MHQDNGEEGSLMTSGSMLISNHLGTKTLLKTSGNTATAEPPENALSDAKAALNREKSSPTVNSGNVVFLTHWIRLASVTPPEKTSVRLAGEPWEKDSYLKNKGDNIGA
jgi:hypothetical protein